jgi:hypothetical protein
MNFVEIRRKLFTFSISVSLLLLSRLDMGLAGIALFLSTFSYLIFHEMHIIRRTMLEIYADAITESKLLHFFLKRRFTNGVLTMVISVFFAANLLLFTNISSLTELFIIGASGLILTAITPSIAAPWFKEGPGKVFGRVAVISIFVLLAILIDGAYTVWSPLDHRIVGPFDENIPDYVIADVHHSATYFQHLLRSITFFNMNIDSIGLCAQADSLNFCSQTDSWFNIVRFILVLSPTPYIAYALLLLSIMSVRRITIVRESL